MARGQVTQIPAAHLPAFSASPNLDYPSKWLKFSCHTIFCQMTKFSSPRWKRPHGNVLCLQRCDVLYQSGTGDTEAPKSAGLNANAPDFNPMSNSNYLATATASLTSLLSLGSNNSDGVSQKSGKVERVFKPPGKPRQVKDEVIIRNSDSGKGNRKLNEHKVFSSRKTKYSRLTWN